MSGRKTRRGCSDGFDGQFSRDSARERDRTRNSPCLRSTTEQLHGVHTPALSRTQFFLWKELNQVSALYYPRQLPQAGSPPRLALQTRRAVTGSFHHRPRTPNRRPPRIMRARTSSPALSAEVLHSFVIPERWVLPPPGATLPRTSRRPVRRLREGAFGRRVCAHLGRRWREATFRLPFDPWRGVAGMLNPHLTRWRQHQR